MAEIKDLPDNYQWMPDTGRYPIDDLGELAARLGSIVTYDRRGTVVLMDRCIVGTGSWSVTGFGTGAEVITVAGVHPFEPYSIMLKAGSDGAAQAQMTKSLPSLGSYKFGIQTSFRLAADGYIVDLLLNYYTGSTLIRAKLRLDANAQELQYLNSGAAYTKITDLDDLASNTTAWHTMKLVFDVTNRVYMRAFLDEEEFSLANIALNAAANVTPKYKYIAVVNLGGGGDNPTVYVNDFILTIGEP